MKDMTKRIQGWIETNEKRDFNKIEERMEPEVAEEVFELDRCIECGCCVAGCGTKRMREGFVGAVALNRAARFEKDPRDKRSLDDWFEIIGDDEGVFGCMSLLGCEDVCPKNLPLQSKIAYLRRKMVAIK
jgi:fumarate reductase iron-sulfur subunit